MLEDLADGDALLHVAVQHEPDQVDALLAHDPGDAQVVVHDLVNGVEGVFLVDDGVEQDAERPDVLLLAAVRVAREDLGRGVVCQLSVWSSRESASVSTINVPMVPTKTSKGPLLM